MYQILADCAAYRQEKQWVPFGSHFKKMSFKKKGIFNSITAFKITYVTYSLQEKPLCHLICEVLLADCHSCIFIKVLLLTIHIISIYASVKYNELPAK